jgi:hypothetical protein
MKVAVSDTTIAGDKRRHWLIVISTDVMANQPPLVAIHLALVHHPSADAPLPLDVVIVCGWWALKPRQ